MNPMIPSPHAVQPSALSKLSLRDKLLLAQAVHEIGTSPPDWGRVSALLLAHPLIRQQSRLEQAANAGLTLGRIFGTRECERAWIALMRQRGLVLGKDEVAPEPATPTPTTPKPKEARGLQPRTDRRSQLALAQLLYAERMEELKEHIREKEEQFKSLVKEIDEIKSGKADARLEMELRIEMENLANGPPLPPSTPGSAAPSVAGPATPASNASTTPKSAKAKGRARGESSANAADLSKISPTRSDVTGTGSAPNSATKKTDLVKTRRGSDRRASIDDSPTKLVPGPTALPSTPSITLPRPTSDTATVTAATTITPAAARATNGETIASTTDRAADAMTTEEAENAVASAATEAAVKVLQDEDAASKVLQQQVDKAAEQLIETETNMELSAQAEGNAAAQQVSATGSSTVSSDAPAAPAAGADKGASTHPPTRPNEAPVAEVVVKEKEPEAVPAATEAATIAEAGAPDAGAKSAAAATAAAAAAAVASTKRKRDGSEPAPATAAPKAETKATAAASDFASPIKKARTAAAERVPSSDVEMDSEDEAEAVVGVDHAQAVQSQETTTANESQDASAQFEAKKAAEEPVKENDTAMEEDSSSDSTDDSSDEDEDEEAEDQVKSVESPHKRSPAKDEATPEAAAKGATGKLEAKTEAEATAKEDADEEVNNDDDQSDVSDDDRKPSSRCDTTPQHAQSSTSSWRAPKPTPPPAPSTTSREQAALKRKTTQVLSMLLTEVSNHTHGNLFHAPIKEQDAPDYYTLIKQPLDIKTIKARIKEGSIADAKQLRKSLTLMFANSLVYNRPGTEAPHGERDVCGERGDFSTVRGDAEVLTI